MDRLLTCASQLRDVAEGVVRGAAAINVLQAARAEVKAIELEMCRQAIAETEAFLVSTRALGDELKVITQRAALMSLVLEWERSARSQLRCAERTDDPMGKRLVQHGGMCYFNCAQALRQHLHAALPQPSPTQEGP
jgi:hypothetical protein